ncbi:hypothetical protein Clacol_009587 [Clathrus columnatus]|uniref:RNA-binding protein VTS1 n=1 Tax=Clathrus columnatus TaxID=1419009 RepID=A0AAV5AR01_9AGAM|nr:hypothetical protein Clacol_009587 [Clathrus columnatus]
MASNNKVSARVSMGPQARPGAGNPSLALPSPRVGGQSGGARPTSELLVSGGASMFQTPEAEAIDQWFENLQNYEVTLEEMAAASLDVNFKEELAAIEQWFRVLSEAERTAALYSLLQQSTQVQIRFFITVLQQMARSDPMTALLSPAAGSMQNQMESKLASLGLKSPGLGGSFNPPASPSARGFGGRSLNVDSTSSFLSPDSAANSNTATDPATTLAQQRAKLHKANANHRISAPPLAGSAASLWAAAGASSLGSSGNSLGQVVEQEHQLPSPTSATLHPPSSNTIGTRPKSMDLSSLSNLRSPRLSSSGPPASVTVTGSDADTEIQVPISPRVGGMWANMVPTPAVPMFSNDQGGSTGQSLYNSANSNTNNNSGFVLEDPKTFRRPGKGNTNTNVAAVGNKDNNNNNNTNTNSKNAGVYGGDDGSSVGSVQQQTMQSHSQPQMQGHQQQQQHGLHRPNRNVSNPANAWNGARSPALSSSSHMMGGMGGMGDTTPLNGLGYSPLPSPAMMNMNTMNMMGMPGLNMNLLANLGAIAAAGLTPEAQAQFFATQMAFQQPNLMSSLAGFSNMAGMGNNRGPGSSRSGGGGGGNNNRSQNDRRSSGRTGGNGSGGGGGGGGDKADEDVDPAVLEDVASWLRSLRLHKYTPNFEGMHWRQMVLMNDEQLEEKGVAALGARRKMLKTFELVRSKMGIPEPAGATTTTTTNTSTPSGST